MLTLEWMNMTGHRHPSQPCQHSPAFAAVHRPIAIGQQYPVRIVDACQTAVGIEDEAWSWTVQPVAMQLARILVDVC